MSRQPADEDEDLMCFPESVTPASRDADLMSLSGEEDRDSVTTGMNTPDGSTAVTSTFVNLSLAGPTGAEQSVDKVHYHLVPQHKRVWVPSSKGGGEREMRTYGVEVYISSDMDHNYQRHGYKKTSDVIGTKLPCGWWEHMAGLRPVLDGIPVTDPADLTKAANTLQGLLNSSPGLGSCCFTVHPSAASAQAATQSGRRLSIDEGIGKHDFLMSVEDKGEAVRARFGDQPIRGQSAAVLPYYERLAGGQALSAGFKGHVRDLLDTYRDLTGRWEWQTSDTNSSPLAAMRTLCHFLNFEESMNPFEKKRLEKARQTDNHGSITNASRARAELVDRQLRDLQDSRSGDLVGKIRFRVLAGDQHRRNFRAADSVVVSERRGSQMLNHPSYPWRNPPV